MNLTFNPNNERDYIDTSVDNLCYSDSRMVVFSIYNAEWMVVQSYLILLRLEITIKMLHVAVAIGLLSFFSAVSADTPSKNGLLAEVASLAQLITDIQAHINASVDARIDEKIDVVDTCWTAKTAEFEKEIQQTFTDILASVKNQLVHFYQTIPTMSPDQIAQLMQEWYVQTGGLLEQAEDAVEQFNHKVTGIHKEVLRLNTLDC